MGCFIMPKEKPNKCYTAEFKQMVVETMQAEGLSLNEAVRRFKINSKGIVLLSCEVFGVITPAGAKTCTCNHAIIK